MKDLAPIISLLNNIHPLNEIERDTLQKELKTRKISKGEYFIKPNQVATEIAFVLKGIMRVYQIVDGKELTSYFSYAERNPFVSSYPSFLQQIASYEYVEAIEDCELAVLSYDSLIQLYLQSKNFETVGRLMAERNYLLAIERIQSLQYHSANDRYEMFLKIYPTLLNRIPHHYIASYLGIAPESMSRIRRQIKS